MPAYCLCGCHRFVSVKGSYRAGHQPAGTSRDLTGRIKKHYTRLNPINNAKIQKRARDEATVRIAKMPKSEPVLTLADAKKKAAEIMLNVGLDGISYEELLGLVLNESASNTKRRFEVGAVGSFYIGYTARQLDEECLRWLTTRGASKQAEDGTFVDPSKRNRPVLLMHDGSTITMGKARKELGFDRVEVYASTLKINARAVEDALQYRYQHLYRSESACGAAPTRAPNSTRWSTASCTRSSSPTRMSSRRSSLRTRSRSTTEAATGQGPPLAS